MAAECRDCSVPNSNGLLTLAGHFTIYRPLFAFFAGLVVERRRYGNCERRSVSGLPTIHPECRLTIDRPRNEVWMQTSGKLLVGAIAASGYCMQLTATGCRRDHAGSSDFGCAM